VQNIFHAEYFTISGDKVITASTGRNCFRPAYACSLVDSGNNRMRPVQRHEPRDSRDSQRLAYLEFGRTELQKQEDILAFSLGARHPTVVFVVCDPDEVLKNASYDVLCSLRVILHILHLYLLQLANHKDFASSSRSTRIKRTPALNQMPKANMI